MLKPTVKAIEAAMDAFNPEWRHMPEPTQKHQWAGMVRAIDAYLKEIFAQSIKDKPNG